MIVIGAFKLWVIVSILVLIGFITGIYFNKHSR